MVRISGACLHPLPFPKIISIQLLSCLFFILQFSFMFFFNLLSSAINLLDYYYYYSISSSILLFCYVAHLKPTSLHIFLHSPFYYVTICHLSLSSCFHSVCVASYFGWVACKSDVYPLIYHEQCLLSSQYHLFPCVITVLRPNYVYNVSFLHLQFFALILCLHLLRFISWFTHLPHCALNLFLMSARYLFSLPPNSTPTSDSQLYHHNTIYPMPGFCIPSAFS